MENGRHPRVGTIDSAHDAKGMQDVRFELGRRILLTSMRADSARDCSFNA
jgi:hypothetical protein